MVKRLDPALCAKCKGTRRLCGRPVCPILKRIENLVKVKNVVSKRELFAATPPSVLVGEQGYPYIWLGPNVAPLTGDSAVEYDNPELWWGVKNINDIIALRSSMVFSRFRLKVSKARSASDKLLDLTREAALSVKPVDAEYLFAKPPRPQLKFDGILSPIGPRARLVKMNIVDNPVVPRKVDNIVEDYDVLARDAIRELYQHGVSFYHIVRIFSLGMLGVKIQRRLVPTRWAITAVDSTLGDLLLKKVKEYKAINQIELYFTEYIGNRYVLILAPGAWSFEMIEIWLPRSVWVKDVKPYFTVNYELYDGRWRRPGVDGGYHAIRFPVLESLFQRRRQATVIAIREVTREYYAPVGSWQIRESVRHALKSKPKIFPTLVDALKSASKYIDTSINLIIRESYLLKLLLTQRKITEFQEK
ncbi:MAG TPA: hypothetical protein ENF53_01430 [Thermoprotei archaeon]|nr:hypothetical protein [Thermoprotei archaeon]